MSLQKAKIFFADSRSMVEVMDETIDLVVTSPPYWHIKDYGVENQSGYGQTLHEYLKDLYSVWKECFRVIKPGRRLCINIGDQFARSIIYGRYRIIQLHAEFITQCEDIGFDYMGSIIWQKKTTMNTTGGATVMGSYPYPPNGMVELDYEFILIFKKLGGSSKVSKELKEKSKLTKEEWKEYFSGHWYFGGARQIGHEAMFPPELPKRLIKMFTFVGDTVLDPFLGSGTTVKVALELDRNAVGYEINENFIEIIREKIGANDLLGLSDSIEFLKRKTKVKIPNVDYKPTIKDAKPVIDPDKFNFKNDRTYQVSEIIDESRLRLNTGLVVNLLGVIVKNKRDAIEYMNDYVLKKEIILKIDPNSSVNADMIDAYVYLKNRIFINSYLIKSGIASADKSKNYELKDKFVRLDKRYYTS